MLSTAVEAEQQLGMRKLTDVSGYLGENGVH
jgi:hypothetical protein